MILWAKIVIWTNRKGCGPGLKIFHGNFGNVKSFHSFAPVLEHQIKEAASAERILKGAEELFFKYGIRSVTMDDIAKHLAVSKKTIYQLFQDKDEVVHRLMEEKLKEDERNFSQIANASSNVMEEFFAIMKHLGTVVGKVNPAAFYDLQKYHPKSWKLFMDFKENCILKMVEESLQRGIKQGLIRSDINTKILARLRMQEIDIGFDPDVFPPEKFRILDVQIALLDHFLYGVCTLKGHKLVNKYKQVIEEE